MYLLVHQYENTLCPGSSDPIYKVSCYIIWVTTSWTHSMPGEQICKMQLFASWDVQKVLSIFIIDQRLVPNKPKVGIKKKLIILFRSTYSMCCKKYYLDVFQTTNFLRETLLQIVYMCRQYLMKKENEDDWIWLIDLFLDLEKADFGISFWFVRPLLKRDGISERRQYRIQTRSPFINTPWSSGSV